MILTFKELAINPADYNGMTFATARAWIINKACDYIMHNFHNYRPEVSEHDVIPNPELAEVCMVMQTVTITTRLPILH